MFMNKHEKRLYFKRKAKEYERKLQRMPQRQRGNRKNVQFSE